MGSVENVVMTDGLVVVSRVDADRAALVLVGTLDEASVAALRKALDGLPPGLTSVTAELRPDGRAEDLAVLSAAIAASGRCGVAVG